jgi:hypothetical protein
MRPLLGSRRIGEALPNHASVVRRFERANAKLVLSQVEDKTK